VWQQLCEAYEDQDQEDIGDTYCNKALERGDPSAKTKEAIGLYEQHKFDEARKLLSTIIKTQNTAPYEAFYYLGLIEDRESKFSEAIILYNTAISKNKACAKCFFDRGRSYQKNLNTPAMQKDMNHACKLTKMKGDKHSQRIHQEAILYLEKTGFKNTNSLGCDFGKTENK
jgi:tetratricopeptide (TPR) repeat protein